MKQDVITWKNAGTDEITDSELNAIGKFINKHQDLIDDFVWHIYRDIPIDCKNWLREGGHKFECDNIGFDDGRADGHLLNLEYCGNTITDFKPANDSYIEPYIEFPTDNSVGDGWVSYVNVNNLQSVIFYNVELYDDFGDGIVEDGCTFWELKNLCNACYNDDTEWDEIVKWNTNMINTLESEYEAFMKDVKNWKICMKTY